MLRALDPQGFGPIGNEFFGVGTGARPGEITSVKINYLGPVAADFSITEWLNQNRLMVYGTAAALLLLAVTKGRR